MRTLVMISLMLAAGCADYNASLAPGGAKAEDTSNADIGGDSGETEDTAPDEAFVPAWVTLSAEVAVSGGVAAPEPTAASFLLADEVGEHDTCDPLATDNFALTEPPLLTDTEAASAWWSAASIPASGCRAWTFTGPVAFGIGPLDPNVRAYLGTVDLEDQADELFGAWFAFGAAGAPTATPFAFGYAQVADRVETGSALPDGTYTLAPLLVVAVPTE
jgi:hypothetical protein